MCDFFCGLQALKDLNISGDKVHVLFDLCFSVYLFFLPICLQMGFRRVILSLLEYFIFFRILLLVKKRKRT